MLRETKTEQPMTHQLLTLHPHIHALQADSNSGQFSGMVCRRRECGNQPPAGRTGAP